jgi:orotate phosphoribosyltransferase
VALAYFVAEELGLPFVYVRPSKKHGRQNQVEGFYKKDKMLL